MWRCAMMLMVLMDERGQSLVFSRSDDRRFLAPEQMRAGGRRTRLRNDGVLIAKGFGDGGDVITVKPPALDWEVEKGLGWSRVQIVDGSRLGCWL